MIILNKLMALLGSHLGLHCYDMERKCLSVLASKHSLLQLWSPRTNWSSVTSTRRLPGTRSLCRPTTSGETPGVFPRRNRCPARPSRVVSLRVSWPSRTRSSLSRPRGRRAGQFSTEPPDWTPTVLSTRPTAPSPRWTSSRTRPSPATTLRATAGTTWLWPGMWWAAPGCLSLTAGLCRMVTDMCREWGICYSDGTNPNIVLRETEIDRRELRDSTELCPDLSCLTTSLVVRWWWHEGRRGGAEIFQCSLSWLWSQQDNYLSQTPGGPLMSRTVVNFPPLLTPTLEATHSWFICKYYDDNSK